MPPPETNSIGQLLINTTPEIIAKRADSKKQNMGLTTWKRAPIKVDRFL